MIPASVLAWADLLPRRSTTLEVTESLGELERLDHDTLLLLVVSDLGVACQGEVLPQGVSVETVVGHDSPQVWVIDEEDTEEIVDFTLVPVGTVVEGCDGWDGSGLVRVGLHPDTRVVTDRQHVVDDLETLVAGRVVYGGDVGDLGELGGGVVFEEGEGGDDAGGRDVDGELILPNGELLDVFGQTGQQILAVLVQRVGLVCDLVGRVDDRGV